MLRTGHLYANVFLPCLFLWILQGSESLRCYVCNSVVHGNCQSPPALEYLVECTDSTAQPSRSMMTQRSDLEPQPESRRNYTFCRKTVASIPKQQNKASIKEAETRIVRSCGWLEPGAEDVCKWGARDGVHREMCTCKKNECNSASRESQFTLLGVTTSFLILLFARIVI